ncbi:hypothetical protein AB0K51_12790 [Kitasatospora sp. NPDC049285]
MGVALTGADLEVPPEHARAARFGLTALLPATPTGIAACLAVTPTARRTC